MLRREFLLSAAAASTGLARRPPNIIWIMGDDLGYSDLGCYGQRIIRTPNIDRLASEGTRFTDTYSGCTVCAPSRSVLLTGKHMGHTTVRSNPGGVPLLANDITIAQVLKQAGYAIGGFGKWGLGDLGTDGVPWKHGFDEFFGYLNQVHAHFYYPRFLLHNDQRYPLPGNENGKRTSYSHDAIAGKALDFIRRSKDKPFFCYLPVTLPHWELLVPAESMAPYRGVVTEDKPFITPQKHYADQPEAHAAYAGMISRLDGDVGRIMALLQELDLDRNTIVFFTSDNGGAMRLRGDDYFQSYASFRGNKQELYEGGIRVPMIVRWPGRTPSGRTSDFVWMFQDVLPTMAALAGVKVPAGLDGQSVLPTLLGKKQKPHEFLYWEQPRHIAATGEFQQEKPMQAVRMGFWKAVRPKPNAPLELYHLKNDPGETRNLAAMETKVLARIETYLSTARTEPLRQNDPNLGYWNEK